MKKGKISAYLISFAMAFLIIINIPTATNAKVMPAGLDTPFALNDDGSVKADFSSTVTNRPSSVIFGGIRTSVINTSGRHPDTL